MGTKLGLLLAVASLAACGGSGGAIGDDGDPYGGTPFGHDDPNNGFWMQTVGDAGSTTATVCAGQYPAHYMLTPMKTFASPLPGTNGLAFDGQELWILAGGYSSVDGPATSTLVRMSVDSLAVDRTFTLDIPGSGTPGIGVGGLVWDGTNLWTTSGWLNTAAIFRLDPTTGLVTRTMSSPGSYDFGFDGSDFWLGDEAGNAFGVDPTTGGVFEHFDVGGPLATTVGIVARPCEVWAGYNDASAGLQVFDPATGAMVADAVDTSGNPFTSPGPSVFIGDQLVIATSIGIVYYDVTAAP